MKKVFIIGLIILAISLSAKSQDNYVFQPDSAKIYFDMAHPNWYYGGVWDFRCSYDPEGLLTHTLVEVVNGEDCLTRDYKYQYDANHNMIYSEYKGYDCESSGIHYKTENVFQNNLIQSQTRYMFALHRQWWVFADSTTFQYDENGRLILKKYFNADCVHTSTVSYDYGDHEKVITTEQLNDNNAWEPLKRVTEVFTELEDLLSSMTETYCDGDFSNSTLVTYSYDDQNHCTDILTQKWENESWENVKLAVNSYDDNGNLIIAKLMKWQDGAFVDANRAVYELNEAGYPKVVNFEKWDEDKWVEGTWISDFYIYSDNHLNRQNKEMCQTGARRIEIYYANTPMPNYKVDDYPIEQDYCIIYPNPTAEMITVLGINLKQAEILNTIGQSVTTIKSEGNHLSVDLSGLPGGIYFVRITDGEGRKCVRKVVKE